MEQVHVNNDLTGWKRYVELQPKISYNEFRLLQQEMFEMLDEIGTSYMKSYREDILIVQGTGRQNRQTYKEAAAFFAIVTAVDLLIAYI